MKIAELFLRNIICCINNLCSDGKIKEYTSRKEAQIISNNENQEKET